MSSQRPPAPRLQESQEELPGAKPSPDREANGGGEEGWAGSWGAREDEDGDDEDGVSSCIYTHLLPFFRRLTSCVFWRRLAGVR